MKKRVYTGMLALGMMVSSVPAYASEIETIITGEELQELISSDDEVAETEVEKEIETIETFEEIPTSTDEGVANINTLTSADGKYQYKIGYGYFDDGEYIDSNTDIIITKYLGTETNVVIPDTIDGVTVAVIGEYGSVFEAVEEIQSIHIGKNITYINDIAINGCISLESITVDSANTIYKDIDGILFTKDTKTLQLMPSAYNITSYSIPNTVEAIANMAFNVNTNIETINIPASVKTIGRKVFNACYQLKSITVDEGNNDFVMYDGALYSKDKTKLIYILQQSGSPVVYTVLDTVTTIGDSAFSSFKFSSADLKEVILPESVISIGDSAFQSCSELEKINLPSKLETIGSFAFSQTSITDVVIPSSVTKVDLYAFSNGNALTHVEILSNELTKIDSGTFAYARGLETIVIPKSITSIENLAFGYCESLSDVYFTGTKAEWDSITIGSSNTALDTATIHYNYVSLADLPTLTYAGSTDVMLEAGNASTFTGIDGITAEDQDGTDLTSDIDVAYSSEDVGSTVSDLDTAKSHLATAGNTVTITYTVTDGDGNVSLPLVITVTAIADVDIDAEGWVTADWITGGKIKFDKETGTITGCEDTVTAVDIPSVIGGVEVTALAVDVFTGNITLESISIPNTITDLGSYTFWGCTSLKTGSIT